LLQQSVAQAAATSTVSPEVTQETQANVVVLQVGPPDDVAQSVSVAQQPGVPWLHVWEERHVYP